jgi:hypothetical protein
MRRLLSVCPEQAPAQLAAVLCSEHATLHHRRSKSAPFWDDRKGPRKIDLDRAVTRRPGDAVAAVSAGEMSSAPSALTVKNAKAAADEPWKLLAAKTAVALAKERVDTSSEATAGPSSGRFMDHADGRNLVVAVRSDFSDQQLLNVFANYAIGAGCTVVAWDRKSNRFADLSKGGVRERKRAHAGMFITANRSGAGGKLRALLSIKEQASADGMFSRKFVHVVGDAGGSGAMACCAGRGGMASSFFPGLTAALHSCGATQFVDIPPLPKQGPPGSESPAPPNQVIGDQEAGGDEAGP